ncbi:MAG: SulP family inorganic anion transporter [Planctomycetota bacterium]|nr:SulP family inorganic anion transporter [Planctomycetota bacterium]
MARIPSAQHLVASALRESIAAGYSRRSFLRDGLAGIVVGVIALPLSMALAIACGMPPQTGLYTAMIGGFVAALFGGSRFQVTGPTAAFVVILAPIVSEQGPAALLIASLLAGIFLVLMGVYRMGRMIEFIPYPVITGFTLGIAVTIALIQLKDFFGLTFSENPESNFQRIIELATTWRSWRLGDTPSVHSRSLR